MSSQFRGERNAIGAFLLLFLALQLIASFRYNLNWDEYYFLSHVYAALDGRMTEALQRFHVYPLFWVALLPFSEADQLVAGRLFMMLCEAGALASVYFISRQFVSRNNALFAVAAWCGAGNALLHGASFRADPSAGFLMMTSLALLLCGERKLWKAVSSGALAAIGILVTVKSMLYLPAFLGAFYWQATKQEGGYRQATRYFVASAIVLATVSIVLFLLHTAVVADSGSVPTQPKQPLLERVGGIVDKVFISQELFPRAASILNWLLQSLPTLLLCAAGLTFAIARRRKDPARLVMVLALLAPLACLVIYRNAFPYFFPFLMFPVSVVAGIGMSLIEKERLRLIVLAAMAIIAGVRFVALWDVGQTSQRQVASVVHQMFPEPVPYIDRNGMIPSFTKSGFFMSGWGTENYQAGITPRLADHIRADSPPLLIANSPWLAKALEPEQHQYPDQLFPSDSKLLRENYVHHWGPIWVAGKVLDTDAESFTIVIPGTYTLDCTGSRLIDGSEVSCGEAILLDGGDHSYSGGKSQLGWGESLYRPDFPAANEPIYYGL